MGDGASDVHAAGVGRVDSGMEDPYQRAIAGSCGGDTGDGTTGERNVFLRRAAGVSGVSGTPGDDVPRWASVSRA